MDLQTITSLMLSADYKDRMKAEYYHLINRMENLQAVLKLWDSGKLSFTPDCPRSIYDLQLRIIGNEIRSFLAETEGIASRFEADRFDIYCVHQQDYMAILEARAKIEKIEL